MKLRGHLSILMWIKVSTLYKRNQNTFTDSELKFFFTTFEQKIRFKICWKGKSNESPGRIHNS